MKSTIYNFDDKWGVLDNKLYAVTDYFQYYTTGVEQMIANDPDSFGFIVRENTERPEQIMFDIFADEDLADTFVAINNHNYLWATPFDLDAFQDAVEFRMNYIDTLMRDRLKGDANQAAYDLMLERVETDVHHADNLARTVFVPDLNLAGSVTRRIKKYFESREVI